MTSLPHNVLFHRFNAKFLSRNKDLLDHVKCTKSKLHSVSPIDKCRLLLNNYCPDRFGTNLARTEACYKQLNEKSSNVNKNILLYKKCISDQRTLLSPCVNKLKAKCLQKNIRAVKTVRLRMMHVKVLLEKMPRLKIIHVLRDPRAVVNSRMAGKSFASLYGHKNRAKEAKLFCYQMLEDIRLRRELEKLFPNRIMQVEFRELAKDTYAVGESILNFTQTPRTPSIKKWLNYNKEFRGRTESTQKNPSTLADAWMNTTTFYELSQMNAICQDYFEIANEKWPSQ